jgi:hypothetical protein
MYHLTPLHRLPDRPLGRQVSITLHQQTHTLGQIPRLYLDPNKCLIDVPTHLHLLLTLPKLWGTQATLHHSSKSPIVLLYLIIMRVQRLVVVFLQDRSPSQYRSPLSWNPTGIPNLHHIRRHTTNLNLERTPPTITDAANKRSILIT